MWFLGSCVLFSACAYGASHSKQVVDAGSGVVAKRAFDLAKIETAQPGLGGLVLTELKPALTCIGRAHRKIIQ